MGDKCIQDGQGEHGHGCDGEANKQHWSSAKTTAKWWAQQSHPEADALENDGGSEGFVYASNLIEECAV